MISPVMGAPRRSGAGRPRDESKTPQILAAVLEVIAEVGYQSLRVEVVAARAGVSPGSVYRRWPTKQDLVVAAIEVSPSPFALTGTGDTDVDLSALLTDLAERLSEPGHTRLALLAADPSDPEVSQAARSQQIPRVRGYLRSLFADRVGADHPALDLLVDIGPALVWYRALVAGEHIDAPALVAQLNRYLFGHVVPDQATAEIADTAASLPAANGTDSTDGADTTDGADSADGTDMLSVVAPTRKDVARNRRRIIAAAAELLEEQDYAELRLEDVAARAGVSRATLVRHVGTKHQLRTAVYSQRLLDVIELAGRAAAEPDPWTGVEVLMRTAAVWAANDAGMHTYLRGDGHDLDDPEWEQLTQRLFAALDAVLDRARQSGDLRAGVGAMDVYPLVSAAVTAADIPGADPSLYTDILLQGLRAPDGERRR